MITISEIQDSAGVSVTEWPGKCHEIAHAAARLIDGAHAVYGHYLGPVAEGTMFAGRAAQLHAVRHGWVLLPDGRVLDPTRWVFEGREPYLYVGDGDHYDEGDNVLRAMLQGEAPMFDECEEVVEIDATMLDTGPWNWLEEILSLQDRFGYEGYEPGSVTVHQLHWIANLDPRMMGDRGEHAVAIHALLDSLRLGAFIPIDNRNMVARWANQGTNHEAENQPSRRSRCHGP